MKTELQFSHNSERSRFVKVLHRTGASIVAVVLFAAAQSALAFTVTITLNEDSTGLYQNSAGFKEVLFGAFAPDPGPGGLVSPLTFALLNPPGLTAGDLFLTDSSTAISDVIRFNPSQPTIPIGQGAAVFYSLSGLGAVADSGLPSANYPNTFTLAENALDQASYTPTSGQPGFIAGFDGPVTYLLNFHVPDYGSSGLLLTIALTVVAALRRPMAVKT